MGRGNYLCQKGDLCDQVYIDYDQWYYTDEETNSEGFDDWACEEDTNALFKAFEKHFPSFADFKYQRKWYHDDSYWCENTRLQNEKFCIGTADNQWAGVIWISDRPDRQDNLTKRDEENFNKYYKWLVEYIKKNFPQTGYLRNGAWMSTPLNSRKE